MKLLSQKRHAIDFLFPVTVFFVFTISALTVILLAARIYQSTTDDSQRNYTNLENIAVSEIKKIEHIGTTGVIDLSV